MTALELIGRLREAGIGLRAVDGELEIDAPRGALTNELRSELKTHKSHLLRLLSWSRRSDQSASVPLQPISRDQPLELSWAQQRLWFLDQLEPGSAAYNISWTVRLKGDLQLEEMQVALDRLVVRHESLRTCFPAADGVAHQLIRPALSIAIEQQDLQGATDEKIRAVLGGLAGRSFDLANGPLLRVTILQIAPHETILLALIHHIVADGASMRILFRELAALYEEELGVAEANLPALAVQYADYAAWQRNWLDGEELDRQANYWRDRLAGLPPLLELPYDRPRSSAMRYRGASVLRVLPDSLANELRGLGRDSGCTLFMVMLAAFYVLLLRYTGRDDLAVGTPMGGRPRTDLEGLIGFFINTVVLRADLSDDPGFDALLMSVRELALEAHAHQELPFERLVEILEPQRELSYSPVFQVMFDLQEEPRWRLPVRDLEVVPEVVFSSRTSSFDLTLSIRQAENGLDAMFEYDTDLFDEQTIERLAGHYQTLLEAIVTDVTRPLSALSLLAPAERQQFIQSWGQPPAELSDASMLTTGFEAYAERQPDATALVGAERSYSYAALNRHANRLAHRLQGLGVGPDEAVVLVAERTPESFMAMLAILKSGACVVPLDPNYPHERLRFMAEDSGAGIALVPPGSGGVLVGAGLKVLELGPEVFTAADYSDANPASLADGHSLAFILYTSGTTGQPKGVELEHQGLLNYIQQLGVKTSVTSRDRILQFASLSFDISIEECFTALLHGATLVLRSDAMVASMRDFCSGCAELEITWLSLPTAWWHELCLSLGSEELQLPQEIRSVVIGGERAQLAAFRDWHAHAPGVRLLNTYGPTETSIVATWCDLTHIDPASTGELPIGSPVPNVSAWVLDGQQQILPAGVPGMLYIGGAGVARRYHARPGLTSEAFVEVEGLPGRLYHTGDRARYLGDGRLIFMGRADGQVKIRGHRIEPAEIEAQLLSFDSVEQAVVLAADEQAATEFATSPAPMQQLVAYFVGAADVDMLRTGLQAVLPEYMLPTAFVRLAELPLTPNGKLDLQALPRPQRPAVPDDFIGPRNSTERKLAEIWLAVLNLERVGVSEDFFALGGHSLLATRVVARIRDVFGVDLPLRALFQDSTIAGIASELDAGAAAAATRRIPVRPASDDLPPLSWAQQRLWFISQLEPDSTAYNLHSAMKLSGSLDLGALQRAVDSLVERHAVLRTRFAAGESEPVQIITAHVSVPIEVADMAETGADHDGIRRALLKLCGQPLRLHSGPLLRVHLLRTAANEHYLLLLMHHIVSDGWSMGVMYRELGQLYAAQKSNVLARLPELPIQYVDYAVWQREWLAGTELLRQEAYWREQLADMPPLLELPADKRRPEVQSYNGAWVTRTFSRELQDGVRRLAAEHGCTVFMVLLAGFKALLTRYTGRDDLVVGTPVAGRRFTELEGLIGFFLNTLPLRTNVAGNPRFTELLARVKATTLGAYDHQDLPFEKLLEVLQPARSLAYPPIVQVMFNLHNESTGSLELDGLDVEPLSLDRATAKFDLSVALAERDYGLQAGFEYNTDLFSPATVTQLLEHFGEILAAAVQAPEQRIGAYELTALLTAPVPAQPYQPWLQEEATLVERFAAIAVANADRPAIDTGSVQVTYAELRLQVDRIAALLISAGVPPQAHVGVLLGQDAAVPAALLGVMQAGCAYVPLDHSAPASRIATVLAEGGVSAVITDDAHRSALPADTAGLQIIDIDTAVEAGNELPRRRPQPEELAYILFTSGSTGVPKGVMQTHRNVLHHVRTYSNALHIVSNDRLSLLPHYGFDAAVMDIYGALLNGACLCPVDLRGLPIEAGLERLFGATQGVSILHATPTVFRWVTSQLDAHYSTASVRLVVLGGEESLAADFEIFTRHFARPALFVNGLGPSESTLALQFFADHDSRLPGRTVPVGRPVADTEVLLVSANNEESDLQGEIVICSPYVATGYWQQPRQSQQSFRPDPDRPGYMRYYTGDGGRRLPDGNLAFTGRLDDQFKLHGQRIEPAEIEARLAECTNVKSCIVMLVGAEPGMRSGESRIVAYISGGADTAQVRSYLRQSLPAYMVPSAIVPVEIWPLTANGKVDRGALPPPEWGRDADRPRVAPRTPAEKELAAIWSDLLQISEPGVHDDFFELGGHSLLATSVIARARDSFGKSISLREFFAAPTVAGCVATLDRQTHATAADEAIRARPRDELPPLSWAQQRLWFLDQLEPDSAAYNLNWAARLSGELRLSDLQTAVDQLIARHESLRTTFGTSDGEPMQLIADQSPIQVQYESLAGVSPERLQQHALKLVQQPFDLRAGPLLRVHVLALKSDESILLFMMHHIVSDGWSMGVLFRELTALYNAAVRGQPADLPELPVQYADYAVWQRHWLSGAELRRQKKYWQSRLLDLPPLLEMPLDNPRPPVQRYRGAWANRNFSPELLDGLRGLAASQGCTLFMVVLAAFYVLVARYTGREDLVVGAPVAGRRRTELEGLIGFFLNTLVLRADVSDDPTFSALLAQVQKTTLAAYDHQELPFEKLLEILRPARSASHSPLVQLTFNLHNEPSNSLSLQDLQVEPFSVDRGTAKFDLSVSAVEGASGLQVGFEYNTDLFEQETVEQWLAHYGEILAGIVSNADTTIATLALTSSIAKPTIAWSHDEFPENALSESVAARFMAMVLRYPDRPAVSGDGVALTYRELNSLANAVAAEVGAVASKPAAPIGLLLGHDAAMVAGLMGVLKSGHAYVPLDPNAPVARIKAVIAAAGVAALVTDGRHAELLQQLNVVTLPIINVPTQVDLQTPEFATQSLFDDPAYVLYTSGSTGTPKGVIQSQRNLLHHIRTYSNALHISEQDRLTLLSSYCFDAAVMDIFGALLNGACLCPLEMRKEEYPGQLLDKMGLPDPSAGSYEGGGITVLHGTPTVFRYLMRHKVCRHDLSGIRAVVLGGEEALGNDFRLFRKHFAPPTLFINGLGPSESTLAMQFFADHHTRLPGDVVPVGYPVADTDILLLDGTGNPAGISGEIAIRSRFLSSGYLGRDDLTASKFVQDSENGVRVYKTGDKARRLPNGALVFMGRLDAQIKVRGHRVEPGEIEATLSQLDGVERCAVVLRAAPAAPGSGVVRDSRLVAYVIGAASSSEMRHHLKGALPDYMMPAAFMHLSGLPYTANGKVDRNALPEPEWKRAADEDYVAPRTATEKQLVGIWADVLGVAEVGIHDDFFELGGHSLLAAQLVSRVTESMRVGLPLRRLFDTPTIAGIAEHVDTLQWALRGRSES